MRSPSISNPISALTEVRPSPIHGVGLFARTLIPAHTVWWHAQLADLIPLTGLQFEALRASAPSPQRDAVMEAFLYYGYYVKGFDMLFFIPDNSRYLNHSSAPNSAVSPDSEGLRSVTLREIAAGEELVEDYRTYDTCPWANLYGEFGRALGHWTQAATLPT